jgi:hypothetical protein
MVIVNDCWLVTYLNSSPIEIDFTPQIQWGGSILSTFSILFITSEFGYYLSFFFLGTHFSTAVAYIQNQVGLIKGNDSLDIINIKQIL